MAGGPAKITPGMQSIVVQIEDVDMTNRLVHAFEKSGSRIQVSFRDIPGGGLLRIPDQGERWTAERQGWVWRLTGRLSSAAEQDEIVNLLQAGDSRLYTPGTLYLDVERVIVNGQPFGAMIANVTLTDAEILNLFTTPIQVIPAPGEGQALMIVGTIYNYLFGNTPFTDNGGQLGTGIGSLRVANGALAFNTAGFWDQTGNQMKQLGQPPWSAPSSSWINQPAYVFHTVANPTLGDGKLSVTVLYSVIAAS